MRQCVVGILKHYLLYDLDVKDSLIIYFVPPQKIVNGGVLSIFSQCKESRRFVSVHNSESVLCTYVDTETYRKNDLFENKEIIYSFNEVKKKWPNLKKLTLQIPECAVDITGERLQKKHFKFLEEIQSIHINVMVQNFELLQSPAEYKRLFKITPYVTQTTAHLKYTTQGLSNLYKTPVHHLSVFIDKSQYKNLSYRKKGDFILYTKDDHPMREEILKVIKSIDGFEAREIINLTYEEYKQQISRAKFCITLREGFDGYFIESFMSGSIALCIYNDVFFPDKSFLKLPTVFKSGSDMIKNLPKVIKSLDHSKKFDEVSKIGAEMVERIYDFNKYLDNLRRFYLEDYSILPNDDRYENVIGDILRIRDRSIDHYKKLSGEDKKKIGELRKEIRQLEKREKSLEKQKEQKIKQLEAELISLINSRSWKLTKPLRSLKKLYKK